MRLRRVLRFRPRYADVAATLALLLATSGTAYAVTALPAHSVGAKQLKKSAVKTAKVAPHAITTSKLKQGAVNTSALSAGAVTAGKLAANSVGGSNVANDSISLADLVGTDVTGPITLPAMAGNTCVTPSITVTGAAVGQVAQFSFTGATAVPLKLVVGPMMVTAADTVSATFCNVGATASAVTSIGVRVITFG